MNFIKYVIVNIIETLLRVLPVPCKTGVIKIGNPDRNSPVFLTGNYHLTVERVKRALRGIDCYLLVANSKGFNVWCGAAGGHFTNHSVISVLKTSGIEKLVDHREVILPQLAATGIEAKVIRKKTGWKVIWGPVDAKDIPKFVNNGLKKTPDMSQTKFPLWQRIEMAVMWAFPFSIILAIITLPFSSKMFLSLTALFWILSMSTFISFPLYSEWLNSKKKEVSSNKYKAIFNLFEFPVFLWGIFMLFLFLYSLLTGNFTFSFIFRWGLISFLLLLILSIDLLGSTPIYKSSLHKDRFFDIFLDVEKCKGAGFCEQVCPRNCFEVDRERHIATMPRADQCIKCGACIVQCPFDALYFKNSKGEIIAPEVIRKYKLNLLGDRAIKVSER